MPTAAAAAARFYLLRCCCCCCLLACCWPSSATGRRSTATRSRSHGRRRRRTSSCRPARPRRLEEKAAAAAAGCATAAPPVIRCYCTIVLPHPLLPSSLATLKKRAGAARAGGCNEPQRDLRKENPGIRRCWSDAPRGRVRRRRCAGTGETASVRGLQGRHGHAAPALRHRLHGRLRGNGGTRVRGGERRHTLERGSAEPRRSSSCGGPRLCSVEVRPQGASVWAPGGPQHSPMCWCPGCTLPPCSAT